MCPAAGPEPELPAITHPDKILFPADGITKGELAAYYDAVAPLMLPHLRGRPVTMERFPSGIGTKGFMQKDVSKGFPPWLERVEVPKKGGSVRHPLVGDRRSLRWLANQNCITPHVWPSRVPELLHPDVCVFDLDPAREDPDVLRAAVLAVRDLLGELGLRSWVKTSGSKGFHVLVPLDGAAAFDEVAAFAHGVGRILVDTGRNGYSATFAAAYAVRPKAGAPISAPCGWGEVERGAAGPRTFTLRTIAPRIAGADDPWSDMPRHGQSLPRAIARLEALPRS